MFGSVVLSCQTIRPTFVNWLRPVSSSFSPGALIFATTSQSSCGICWPRIEAGPGRSASKLNSLSVRTRLPASTNGAVSVLGCRKLHLPVSSSAPSNSSVGHSLGHSARSGSIVTEWKLAVGWPAPGWVEAVA